MDKRWSNMYTCITNSILLTNCEAAQVKKTLKNTDKTFMHIYLFIYSIKKTENT